MRVSSDTAALDIAPGDQADVTLNVVNTGSVIDGISARVVGLPERNVTSRPALLPLFPDSAGQLTLTLGLPQSFPAGRHPMTVEVHSRQVDAPAEYVNVELVVPRSPGLGLTSRPEVVRARRTARFIVTVTNRGNVPLDVALKVNDPQKICAITMQPPVMSLPAGAATQSVITVRVRRMFMGTEMDQGLTVLAIAQPVGAPAALVGAPAGSPTAPPAVPAAPAPEGPAPAGQPGVHPDPARDPAPATDPAADPGEDTAEPGDEPLVESVPITVRQRPYLTRGVLTALILVAIIALWAAVFLFGLARVFSGDPLTKTAPASFFAATPETSSTSAAASGSAGSAPGGVTVEPGAARGAAGDPAAEGAAAGGGGGPQSGGGVAPAAAPAGALPKHGALPAGVGGTISGTVTAASSGQPVGRILVQAQRIKADGSTVTVSSAATQSDGSYQVAGLFPGDYLLRLSAPGFRTSYYPAASSPAQAQTITASTGAVTPGGDAVVTGLPATITGQVDPGDTTGKVTTTVSARLLQQGTGEPVTIPDVTAVSDGKPGRYTFSGLPAPGTYQLTFTTPGYEPSTVQTTVTGGAKRFESTVVLSAGTAQIAGVVTDGTDPLGGATVSTTVNGKQISTGTPTTGQVGRFVLGDLPTPATYVITVSKDGYGKVSQVIDLAPDKSQQNLTIALRAGSGVVSGRLVDSAGVGIGGATVTVGGLADPPSTVTLTNGAVGTFRLTGLPVPGSYTLTFTLDGYADQTVPVRLRADEALTPLTVTMSASVGSITGRVTGPGGAGLPAATVTATDGRRSWPVITTGNGAGGQVGSYTVATLPAGIYTVTAQDSAGHSQTALVTVQPGSPETLNFHLAGGG